MGKNKLQKFEEMASFSNVVEVPFKEVFNHDHSLKGLWSKSFFGNNNPVVLELGCGKGEYTIGLARSCPYKNFIGIDIKGNRMHSGASHALAEGLKNAAFLRTHVELTGSFFGRDEVDEIWLTFPDPQMKKFRKRLTSTWFLSIYAQFLKQGGWVHLKTDSQFLYTYTRELIRINNLELAIDYSDLHASGSDIAMEAAAITTYYENKWLAHGVSIKYLKFSPHAMSGELIEPDIEIEPDSYRSAGRGVKNDFRHANG